MAWKSGWLPPLHRSPHFSLTQVEAINAKIAKRKLELAPHIKRLRTERQAFAVC
jgi:hypothetical protein